MVANHHPASAMSGTIGPDASGTLLGALYGFAPASAAPSGDPIAALRAAERDEAKDIAATARQPQVQRDVAAFRAGVAKAGTPAALLSDPAVLKVLLTANGLGDQQAYPALARKALMSNLQDPKSLANTLADTRWKAAARTFAFAAQGLAVIRDPKVLNTLASGYAEVTWRKSLDRATPGLSNALDFRARAAAITSVDQILGNGTLRTVVTTALGIPLQIALQPLEAQERAISSRVDIAKFKDPAFVDKFTQRYLIAAAAGAPGTPSADLVSLSVQARGLLV